MHFVKLAGDETRQMIGESAADLYAQSKRETDPAIREMLRSDVDDLLDLLGPAGD